MHSTRPTKSPSQLTDHLGYWLRAVSNQVSHAFARQLTSTDVTVAEWVALRTLYDHAPIAPSRLAEQMGMTRGAISKLADRLVSKRLVMRTDDPADQRAQILELTARGRQLVPELARIADANDDHFFGQLDPADRDRLGQLLRALARRHDVTDPPID